MSEPETTAVESAEEFFAALIQARVFPLGTTVDQTIEADRIHRIAMIRARDAQVRKAALEEALRWAIRQPLEP